jgi:hypothetical protein
MLLSTFYEKGTHIAVEVKANKGVKGQHYFKCGGDSKRLR